MKTPLLGSSAVAVAAQNGEDTSQFRDCCHAFGGEQAADFQLAIHLRIRQHCPHQAGYRNEVREDAHHVGSAYPAES